MSTQYPVDFFIGQVLNIPGFSVNGYPLSFVIWNIALAVVAVLIGQFTARAFKKKEPFYIKFGLLIIWLALLPNTAYLMTDARHIIGYCPLDSYGNVCSANAWMTFVFFTYAALGWPAFVLALRPMHHYISKRFNKKGRDYGLAFVAIMCFLSSLGVLLGLLNRFNSWEIVTKPMIILQSAYSYFNELVPFINWAIISVVLIILYMIGEKIFVVPANEKD